MSRENLEAVRRVYDAAARHEAETVLALYDPEVEWDYRRGPFADVMGRDIYRGHEGLRTFFREAYEAWETFESNVEELIDAGDQVISVVTNRGRGRASGIELEITQHAVWTIREGRITRVVWLPTREEALEAVGLRE